jgi:hypothetical protein
MHRRLAVTWLAALALPLACGASDADPAIDPSSDAGRSEPDAVAPSSSSSSSSSGSPVIDASHDAATGDAAVGWPDANSTGPRSPTTTTESDTTFDQAGTEANPIVHEHVRFEGTVTLAAGAAWHVFRDCVIDTGSYWGFRIDEDAQHIVIENCEVSGPQTAIAAGGTDISIRACNLHDTENGVTTYGSQVTIADNWIHNDGIGRDWGNVPHWDSIEVYGGTNVHIVHNELSLDGHEDTSLVNVAPWGDGASATMVTVENNRMGGGGYHFTLDDEQPNGPHVITGIVLSNNRHRAGGVGLANIRDGVGYTWSDVWDCNDAPAELGAWPPPCE